MHATIGRLFWLPRTLLSHEQEVELRSNLMIDFTESDGGVVKLFEISDSRIGIPRALGLSKYSRKVEVDDCAMTRVLEDWPELKFPAGGTYREGQKSAIDRMTEVFQEGSYGALLEAHAGSGKTLMAAAIASNLKEKTLVLVHKNDLAEQWHETFKTFFPGIKVGHCQGDAWKYKDCHIVTAMAQTIYRRKDTIPTPFFNEFGLVIFDEGHRYPARTFEQVMRSFPARYRMAVSATWRRRDDLECIWHWHIGKVEHRLSADRLVGEYTQIPWETNLQDGMFKMSRSKYNLNTARYITSIARNVPYNRWLANQVVLASGVDRRVLLVSDRVEQCLKIRELVLSACAGVQVGLYVGAIEGRKVKKDELERAKHCPIILATYGMMSEGTDIPELDTLFFGTPRGEIEQVVGRIQRPEGDKKTLLVVDPVFQTRYMMNLGKKRKKFYKLAGFQNQGE